MANTTTNYVWLLQRKKPVKKEALVKKTRRKLQIARGEAL
jgi:hypothetical protein